jgi:tetratricopeptide (TPR) repeat protein
VAKAREKKKPKHVERKSQTPTALHPGVPVHTLAVLVILSVLSAAIYSNTLSASFHFDDGTSIVENAAIKNLANFLTFSGPRYVGDLSFALNYRFGGLDVFGYHLVNTLIHTINGFLVYCLLLLLFRAPGMTSLHSSPEPFLSHGVSLFASLLFIAHPIQTQAVTYIAQRFTSLAALFYLLTIVCYLRWRLSPPERSGRHPWYAGALLCTVLAMKTKEISFTLPVMLLLVELVFFRPLGRKDWFALAPFFLTLPIIPLSRFGELHQAAVQEGVTGFSAEPIPAPDQLSKWAALFTQLRATMTYLRLLVVPIDQNLEYDYPVHDSFLHPAVLFSALALTGLFTLALYWLVRSRRSPRHAPLALPAFGLLWLFLTFSIEWAFSTLALRDVIIEHRLYLPSVGFCMAVGVAGAWLSQRMPDRFRWAVIGAAVGCLALFTVAAHQRNAVWRDELSLWTDVVSKSPDKARPHNNLGVALKQRGDLAGAIAEFRTALRLNPNYVDVHENLGNALNAQGDVEGAMAEYHAALRLNPDDANAHYNLGAALVGTRDLEGAVAEFQAALRLNPDLADAHSGLGAVLTVQGDLAEAEAEFRAALRLNPSLLVVHYNLGVVLMEQGSTSAAAEELEAFIRLNSSVASDQHYVDDAKRRLDQLKASMK